MQRKQRRHHEAAAAEAGRSLQDPEQQHDIQHMQQHVHIVRAGRIQIEELAIQSVREPRQRMPRADAIGGEAPADGVPGHAVLHHGVLRDVDRVVVVDEREAVDAQIQRRGNDDEDQAEREILFQG